MKNIVLILIYVFSLCQPAHGATETKISGTYAPGIRAVKNFVKNPDCELNTLGITASAGTLVRSTTSPLVAGAGSHCTWTPSGSGQTLKFDINTLSPNVKAGNCEVSFYTGTTTSGDYVAWLEYDSVQVTDDLAVYATTAGQKFSISYPCSSSVTTRKLVLETTASASAINIGGVSFGENLGVGNLSTTGNLSSYTPTFTGFGTVSSYYIETVKMGPNLVGRGYFVSGTSTAVEARISLGHGGVNSNVSVKSGIATNTLVGSAVLNINSAANIVMLASPGNSYLTFGIQNATNSGSTSVNGSTLTASTNRVDFEFTVPIEGWNASQPSVTLNDSGAYTNLETYTAGCSGTWNTNATYTCKKKRSGDVLYVEMRIDLSGAPNSANLFVDLPTGLTIDTTKMVSVAASDLLRGKVSIADGGTVYSGGIAYATTSTLRVTSLTVSGANVNSWSTVTQAAPFTFGSGDSVFVQFEAPISGWSTPSVPVPLVVGSVSSNTNGMERVERACFGTTNCTTACSSSPCFVGNESGDWISSVTRNSQGSYTVTLNSGIFSAAPECQLTNKLGNRRFYRASASSATSISIDSDDSASAVADSAFSIFCMGPR